MSALSLSRILTDEQCSIVAFLFFTIYFLAVNLTTYGAMGLDAASAQTRERRISSKFFLVFSFLGGGIGVWAGNRRFCHKPQRFNMSLSLLLAIIYVVLFISAFAGEWFRGLKCFWNWPLYW